MLEIIKEMQKQGVFQLLPNNELDGTIKRLGNESDIAIHYDSIRKYLKNLINQLSYEHNVVLNRTITDFRDKFSYEMFDMAFTCANFSNGIYQKETRYGNAGDFSLGVDMFNATFTLEERKLLKIINHYYISLMHKDGFDEDYFYVPMDSLKLAFPKVNNTKLKEKIVDTCSRLNNKTMYWDFSKSQYSKDLKPKNLNVGNKEKLLDIDILYFPSHNKNSSTGMAIEIKGIICRISKFMKLRFEIGQYSHRFSTDNLSYNYLSFIIADNLDYHLHLNKIGSGKKDCYNINFRDLAEDIKVYCNHKQQRDTYLSKILNEPNSKDSILKLLEAIINALNNLSDVYCSFSPIFKVRNREIKLDEYLTSFKAASTRSEKDALVSNIYDSVVQAGNMNGKEAPLRYLIRTGNLSMIIKF